MMAQEDPQLLIGVSAGFNSIHTIVVREEADGRWRLMGEYRHRKVVQPLNIQLLVYRVHESIERAISDAQVSLEDILAVGIALPGQIDIDRGLILFSPYLGVDEEPFPFIRHLRKMLDVDHIAVISNDDAQGMG